MTFVVSVISVITTSASCVFSKKSFYFACTIINSRLSDPPLQWS